MHQRRCHEYGLAPYLSEFINNSAPGTSASGTGNENLHVEKVFLVKRAAVDENCMASTFTFCRRQRKIGPLGGRFQIGLGAEALYIHG